jgi:DNA-binding MarR family transcriptional regulator
MAGLSETRRKILELISQGEAKRVKDLEEALQMTRPAVIRHLNESEAKGWIVREKHGRETYLRATPEGLIALGIPPEETYNDLLKKPHAKLVIQELLMAARVMTPEELVKNVVDRHGGVIKEEAVRGAIEDLEKERIIVKREDGKLDISYLGLVLISKEENGYSSLLSMYFKRLLAEGFKFYQDLLKGIIPLTEKALVVSPVDIVDVLKNMDKDLALFLRKHEATISAVKADDSLFNKLEESLKESLFKNLLTLAIKKLPSELLKRVWK